MQYCTISERNGASVLAVFDACSNRALFSGLLDHHLHAKSGNNACGSRSSFICHYDLETCGDCCLLHRMHRRRDLLNLKIMRRAVGGYSRSYGQRRNTHNDLTSRTLTRLRKNPSCSYPHPLLWVCRKVLAIEIRWFPPLMKPARLQFSRH